METDGTDEDVTELMNLHNEIRRTEMGPSGDLTPDVATVKTTGEHAVPSSSTAALPAEDEGADVASPQRPTPEPAGLESATTLEGETFGDVTPLERGAE